MSHIKQVLQELDAELRAAGWPEPDAPKPINPIPPFVVGLAAGLAIGWLSAFVTWVVYK